MRFLVIFILLSFPANAEDWRTDFYGKWGTPDQCAGALIKQGGTVKFEPFEIGREWLKHGELWCQITWGPLERRSGELFTAVTAKCGEDAVRGYLLGMKQKGGNLTLRWDYAWANGPLQRCPIS